MKIFLKLFLLTSMSVIAQNPITPPGMYIADPEAHVWEDGKLYVYGSRDESDEYWCSYSYHVLRTSNLTNWTVSENTFASKGKYDQVDYNDKLLFAPDCAYKNGLYYLYYCSPGKKLAEGVATSKSPNGPFENGKNIRGLKQIDPAVLVDDDGQAYYYWGQGKPKVARLKSNMIEIDESTITYPLDEKGNIAFHEGSSIRKIGNLYYFVFADDSRNNRPTCLGYAIGKSPMGPFTYKGVLIDNIGCDPKTWNNHGSIEKFKDKWYVFYHRSTNNSQKFRKACIEPIVIHRDGTIDEVEMTSQGAGENLNPMEITQAEWACNLSGNVRVSGLESWDEFSEGLTEMQTGDVVAFKYFKFSKGVTSFEIKTTSDFGGKLEIRLDSPDGKIIGLCDVKNKKNNQAYIISSCIINTKVKGKHALYFKAAEAKVMCIDWFRFL